MSIALFAILGAITKAHAGYWIVFGFYCLFKLMKAIYETAKEDE